MEEYKYVTPSVPINKSFYGSDLVPERMSSSCCSCCGEREKLSERGNNLLTREGKREKSCPGNKLLQRKRKH
jgi:hypothetical protein